MKTPQLFSAFALLITGACGSSVGGIHEATAKEVLAQDGEGVLAQYRLVIGDYEARSSAAECVPLRGKIATHRDQVRLGSEWRSLVQTAEFQALDNVEARFRDNNCKANNADASEVCSTLEGEAKDLAGAVAKTPQWNTLANNTHWHEMIGDVRKAQQIECL